LNPAQNSTDEKQIEMIANFEEQKFPELTKTLPSWLSQWKHD
jgi:hypothetical protein